MSKGGETTDTTVDTTGAIDRHDAAAAAAATTSRTTAEERKEIYDVLAVVDESIDVMSNTLNDVLSFAAIEEGQFDLHCASFIVGDMLRSVEATHQLAAKKKDVRLETMLMDPRLGSLRLHGDSRRLAACVSNYVSNALKFIDGSTDDQKKVTIIASTYDVDHTPTTPTSTTAAPTTTVTTTTKGKKTSASSSKLGVRIDVNDNGIGIREQDQASLFHAFTQIRPGELQQGRGSGLGLAICREIVQHHGGNVGLQSDLGKGSTFFIQVPLAVVKDDDLPTKRSPSSQDDLVTSPRPPPHLAEEEHVDRPVRHLAALVVDDCPSNRKLLSMQVGKLGFHRVVQAENGADAVDVYAASGPYDVVFMDHCMPVMSGSEATAQLRRNNCRATIIGVTGNALNEDIAIFKSAGANDVLTKPVSKARIEAKLRELNLLP